MLLGRVARFKRCASTSTRVAGWLGLGCRWCTVHIGDVAITRRVPAHPGLVPRIPAGHAGTRAADLQWMARQFALRKDMYLLGTSAAEKRALIHAFAALVGLEVETLHLSRDTSEADLKQRRELVASGASSTWADQAAIRAALHGRLLVLDGVERAERNVMPTLNNLLENREVALDDGRFLVSTARWHQLQEAGQSEAQLRAAGIVPAHPDFIVVALGLPVPPLPGNPLDPPLRSRFACRYMPPESGSGTALWAAMRRHASTPAATSCADVAVSLGAALHMMAQDPGHPLHATALAMPPLTAAAAARYARASAALDDDGQLAASALHTVYPYHMLDGADVAAPGSSGSNDKSRRRGFAAGWLGERASAARAEARREHAVPATMSELRASTSAALREAELGWLETVLKSAGLHGLHDVRARIASAAGAPVFWTAARPSVALHASDTLGALEWRVNERAMACRQLAQASDASVQRVLSQLPATRAAILAEACTAMLAGGHVCLVGTRGEGKSFVAYQIAQALGYKQPALFALHTDMSARDLLQRRTIHAETGETTWELSPLLQAAVQGNLCILDNVGAVPADTLAVLDALLSDQRMDLYDGTRLVPQAEWDALRADGAVTEHGTLVNEPERKVVAVHPSFRVAALAEPTPAMHALARAAAAQAIRGEGGSVASMSAASWLHPALIPCFSMHAVPPLDAKDAAQVARQAVPSLSQSAHDKLQSFVLHMRAAAWLNFLDEPETGATVSLSLRQHLHLARQLHGMLLGGSRPSVADLRAALHAAVLAPFRSEAVQAAVDKAIAASGVLELADTSQHTQPGHTGPAHSNCGSWLRSGTGVRMPVQRQPASPELVPSPRYYDNASHAAHLNALLGDIAAGEKHLLLIGSQGTAKNVLADRMLHLLGWEREYIQVHRDSTVASLTLSARLQEGRVRWQDSALVRAAQHGRVLLLDEGDKAPPEVLATLRGLLEDGQMLLGDGRRIIDHTRYKLDLSQYSPDGASGPPVSDAGAWWQATRATAAQRGGLLLLHPDFRVWVLANRPGMPFHGNDFFAHIGDSFVPHIIGAADSSSELQLLQRYAPDVPRATLQSVAAAFKTLRDQHAAGELLYPFSTREAVAVARHLQAYPQAGAGAAAENVLAFEAFNPGLRSTIAEAFAREGIRVSSNPLETGDGQGEDAQVVIRRVARDGATLGEWTSKLVGIDVAQALGLGALNYSPPDVAEPKHGEEDDEPHTGGSNFAGGTGGSNTAGLGGRAGPYRLDKGGPVTQVSQEAKDAVPPQVAAKAQAMAQAALHKRLQELDMDAAELDMYNDVVARVAAGTHALRNVLSAVQLKSHDRVWLKQQSHGELDDTKLVDAASGERNVYKRRGLPSDVRSQSSGSTASARAAVHLVVDTSASMYRFNSADGRLSRMVDTAGMFMEALAPLQDSYDWAITGHSGDSERIPLVQWGEPPTAQGDRMRVLQRMVAHTQYSWPGDHTLEAMAAAAKDPQLQNAPPGQRIVLVFSDANLRRYRITPQQVAAAMQSGPGVKTFMVFIASMGAEADTLVRALPAGHAFVAHDTSQLPAIMQRIIAAHLGTV